ncbi:MAG: hypothetical protein C4336_06260 [Armatimonadota bacterium]
MNSGESIPTHGERLWAMLAHLSGLLGSVMVILVIFLVFRERSRFVAYHAIQQLLFQLLILIATTFLIVVAVVTCGIGLVIVVPLAVVLGIADLVCIIWAAIEAHNGKWFRIPWVGDMARWLTEA